MKVSKDKVMAIEPSEKKKFCTLAVVLPCRNGSKYLPETLNSLENQTKKPTRIILSDNRSTDNSNELFFQFAQRNPNTNIISPTKYLKEIGQSFNFAAYEVREDWIYFLHSDDVLSPRALEVIYKEIVKCKEDIGLISFQAEWIDENSCLERAKFTLGRRKIEKGISFITSNLGGSSLNFGAVIINRRIFNQLGGFENQNSYWLDLQYYHKLIGSGYKILRVPKPILRYRVYQNPRLADDRENIDSSNRRYWIETYLPELAKKYQFSLSPSSDSSNFVIQLKLFLKRENRTKVAMRRLQVKIRKLLDKIGIGMFG